MRATIHPPVAFRQLLRGPAVVVHTEAGTLAAQVGDYLGWGAIRAASDDVRRRLGPVRSPAQVRAACGRAPEPLDIVFRPGGDDDLMPAHVGARKPLTHVVDVRVPAGADRAAVLALLRAALEADPGAQGVFIADADVEVPDGVIDKLGCVDAAAVYPMVNQDSVVGVPLPGDPPTGHQRMPGGRTCPEINRALADVWSAAPEHPVFPCAGLLTRELADAVARGNGATVARATRATSLGAYVRRPTAREGALGHLLPGGGAADAPAWGSRTRPVRAAVAAYRDRGLPVVFFSHAIGPWGGVLVLMRLADELRRYGFWSTVVHHREEEHPFRPDVPPLRVPSTQAAEADWKTHVGVREGIIVGSSWGSGATVANIARENPGLVTMPFLQDREDLFETASRRRRRMNTRAYFELGPGVSVAKWIVDSAAGELGVDVAGYQVIPPGVEDWFQPRERSSRGPVRFAAMWRPQTPVRRGLARLAALYDAIKAQYGNRVSLEVFGWSGHDDERPPASVDVNHGTLDRAGVGRLLADVDVVVEPSDFQGFGLPGLEAMACGAALLSTQCKGVDEYARDGVEALILPHGNLFAGARRLIESGTLRRELGQQAVETARHFRWRYVVARWALRLARVWDLAGGDAADVAQAREVAAETLAEMPNGGLPVRDWARG